MLAIGMLALLPVSAGAADPSWQPWVTVPGVFDLGGPRSDGTILAAGSGGLFTLNQAGAVAPFASGYRGDDGAEAYLAVSPGLHVASTGCDFARDDTYILRLHQPTGITRVDATGAQIGSLANANVPGMNGIAFDTIGSFDHRLLATGTIKGKTELVAIDCNGAVQVITKTGPVLEGGLAVAPSAFGIFGGSLIAPDELSGIIWAVGPDGTSHQVVASGLPKGGDIGVEAVAFVPPGFTAGGYLYYSDRATSGNPHPGTNHVLRLSSTDLVAAGVRDGDLLAATEGGASMIDVRCDVSCRVATIVGTPTTAHGEGHLVFTFIQPAPPAQSGSKQVPATNGTASNNPVNSAIAILAIVGVISVAGWLILSRRRD
jgi:hypothetical protein